MTHLTCKNTRILPVLHNYNILFYIGIIPNKAITTYSIVIDLWHLQTSIEYYLYDPTILYHVCDMI